MTSNGLIQILVFFLVLILSSIPIGIYIKKVFSDEKSFFIGLLRPVEKLIYKLFRIDVSKEMNWKEYSLAMISFNLLGFAAVFIIQRTQGYLFLNPASMANVPSDTAFNTAASFATNTNWQAYGGESTMSYFTQMFALTVQNFLSAATGIAILVALARGFKRKLTNLIGNFWSDLTKSTIYILTPFSLILAILLVSQGVVQTFAPYQNASLLEPQKISTPEGVEETISEQVIAVGPAASQIAIKQLGTNGGGFFNVNSAHPLENPSSFSNFLELLSILIIPAALCITFGELIGLRRQGYLLLSVMTIILLAFTIPCYYFESQGNPSLNNLDKSKLAQNNTAQNLGKQNISISQIPSEKQPGGNMEGKETRFGITNSVLWATATTAASNGSVNSMHDSYMPLSSLSPLLLMQLGEVIFGGVGSGLYGMIAFGIVTVFIAGLMVGRTPEYLGKKLGSFEIKMVSLVVLIPCVLVLIGTAIAVTVPSARASITNPGSHGFTQALYAYSSMGNNNGSAFGGFGANIPLHNFLGGVIMFISRFWLAIPILALAGSLAKKNHTPNSVGTLRTDTFLFGILLSGVVLLVGALTFVPSLALGPVVEQLTLQEQAHSKLTTEK